MTKTEVLDVLKENRDARGEANWKEMGDRTGGLTSFGIGLTKLRAIAKQVGRDHDLALKLWNERNHDAKIIGLLIDDPKQLTRDQVEKQVDEARPGNAQPRAQLVRCDPGQVPDRVRDREGLDGEHQTPSAAVAATDSYTSWPTDKKDERLTDEFFLGWRSRKDPARRSRKRRTGRASRMGGALMSIGKRNKKLNAAAIKLAKAIGPIPLQRRGQEVRADERAQAPDQPTPCVTSSVS